MLQRTILALAASAAIVTSLGASATTEEPADLGAWAYGSETCTLKGQKASGLNTICYYSCASGEVTTTVRGSLCPSVLRR